MRIGEFVVLFFENQDSVSTKFYKQIQLIGFITCFFLLQET